MKEIKAWAVVNKKGNLAVISEKVPIFWLKKAAASSLFSFNNHKVVKVKIVEVKD